MIPQLSGACYAVRLMVCIKHIHLYTILKQGISTIFIDLSCFQKSTLYVGIKILNSLPTTVTFLKNVKTKFKEALRKYLNTHFFY